jgi:hypothetical protein
MKSSKTKEINVELLFDKSGLVESKFPINEMEERGYTHEQNLIAPFILPYGHTDWYYLVDKNFR